MNTSLVQITSFAATFEAEHAKIILEEEGISAFVDGAAAGTALSHLGAGLGGVRLMVLQRDAARAVEILSAMESEPEPEGDAWYCGDCRAQVDPGFGDCWSCGEPRENVEQPFPQPDETDKLDDEEKPNSDSTSYSVQDHSNPYVSPSIEAPARSSNQEPVVILSHQAEAMVQRAWRASIIGMLLIPLVLNIYSMILLIRASTLCSEFSPLGTRRFYRAVAVNVLAGGFWGILLSRILY